MLLNINHVILSIKFANFAMPKKKTKNGYRNRLE